MSTLKLPLTWPLLATCGACGGELHIYPYPAPQGSGYCAHCSPAWLEPFLVFATKDTAQRGYRPRESRAMSERQAARLRRRIASDQLEAARQKHQRCLADENVGLSWLAQDRVWFWCLKFQAAELLAL